MARVRGLLEVAEAPQKVNFIVIAFSPFIDKIVVLKNISYTYYESIKLLIISHNKKLSYHRETAQWTRRVSINRVK